MMTSIVKGAFVATLLRKVNALTRSKQDLSLFQNFVSDKVEIIFWKSNLKLSKLHKSKVSIVENSFEDIFW